MIRLLHVLSGLAILLAGGVFAVCVRQWSQDELACDSLLVRPGAVEVFLRSERRSLGEAQERDSPLLAEASALAAYLNPPAPVKTQPVVQVAPKPAPATPVVRPPAASPKFKVCGTSCCDDQPQRSMALILEPGTTEPARWVRRGTQVGHFLIQEVRPGSVVYLDGEQVHEMAIEQEAGAPTAASASNGAADWGPLVAAKAETTRPSAATKRPARSRSMTVGSARTAALD